MNAQNLYPEIVPEEDVIKMIDQKSNVYRVKAIKDFINVLKNDYAKYNKQKHKLCIIKNILMSAGIGTAIVSIATISFGLGNIILGLGLAIGGALSLPVINKIVDKYTSKKRNLETLANKYLSEVKLIFSKALDDKDITHEEFETVMECKDNYVKAKQKLKSEWKKEMNDLINNTKESIFASLTKKDMKQLNKQAKNEIRESQKQRYLEDLKSKLSSGV